MIKDTDISKHSMHSVSYENEETYIDIKGDLTSYVNKQRITFLIDFCWEPENKAYKEDSINNCET